MTRLRRSSAALRSAPLSRCLALCLAGPSVWPRWVAGRCESPSLSSVLAPLWLDRGSAESRVARLHCQQPGRGTRPINHIALCALSPCQIRTFKHSKKRASRNPRALAATWQCVLRALRTSPAALRALAVRAACVAHEPCRIASLAAAASRARGSLRHEPCCRQRCKSCCVAIPGPAALRARARFVDLHAPHSPAV